MRSAVFLIALITLLYACQDSQHKFVSIDPSHSNIHFNNIVVETDSLNILNFEYIYNGGGIGLADFNNDGLEDIYVAGNIVDNALYLNEGNMSFKDITVDAAVASSGTWTSGVTVVDINNDGWQDIYVCNTTSLDSNLRVNNFYINQGLNDDGTISFIDKAKEYGLDDNSFSVHAAFFDYDNDKDLDMMIIVNEMGNTRYHSQYRAQSQRTFFQRVDRLYENIQGADGAPKFVNVSDKAGIKIPGFSLSINICDINKDGWKDIYISNDFLSDDIFYVNQQNGTFIDKSRDYLKHTSHSAMGNDVVDINNDGYSDIIALDMLPEGNYRQKRLLGETNYNAYLNFERFDYSYQFVRNTLQLNNGIDQYGAPMFSDVSLYSGISATDWSWAPLVADFDQDGYRDIIITNGFPRDVTDHDFIDYQNDAYRFVSREMLLSKIPSIKINNYAYKNTGGIKFEDVSEAWGLNMPSYSNGAAYGDLDNDGDLDLVINNINDSLTLYKNSTPASLDHNAINIALSGSKENLDALGTHIKVYTDQGAISYEHSIYRGYLSSHSKRIHIGIGDAVVKNIEVTWPTGEQSLISNPTTDGILRIDYEAILKAQPNRNQKLAYKSIITNDTTFTLDHKEEDFIDYNIQPLLPHKLSEFGPSISVGDLNSDGLDDVYIGGSTFYKGQLFYQKENGQFRPDSLQGSNQNSEELGTIIADFDGDGDNDIFIASGSYELQDDSAELRDQLFINEGGSLKNISDVLPTYVSNACNVTAVDFDQDLDIDILIGGRVHYGEYPNPAKSFLLENVSEGEIKFKLSELSSVFSDLGMVTDLLWTDYNDDTRIDVVMTTELGEIHFLKNSPEGFVKDDISALSDKMGFWNSVSAGDLDSDGDIDYVVGNIGLNTYFPISSEYPYRIYVNDFDDNGSEDILPFVFLKDQKGQRQEYPFSSRMDFAKEINAIRKMLPSYKQYALADRDRLITKETLDSTKILEANYPYTSILWNNGQGGFDITQLPLEVQLAPIYGSIIKDIDQDGHQDILLVGNDFGNELVFGRMDAFNGILLLGQGDKGFRVSPYKESGFYVPDNGKSLTTMWTGDHLSFISGSNKGKIRKHDLGAEVKSFTLEKDDFRVRYTTNKNEWVSEHPYGQGFLSQGSRKIIIPDQVIKIQITKSNGESRTINI